MVDGGSSSSTMVEAVMEVHCGKSSSNVLNIIIAMHSFYLRVVNFTTLGFPERHLFYTSNSYLCSCVYNACMEH